MSRRFGGVAPSSTATQRRGYTVMFMGGLLGRYGRRTLETRL